MMGFIFWSINCSLEKVSPLVFSATLGLFCNKMSMVLPSPEISDSIESELQYWHFNLEELALQVDKKDNQHVNSSFQNDVLC